MKNRERNDPDLWKDEAGTAYPQLAKVTGMGRLSFAQGFEFFEQPVEFGFYLSQALIVVSCWPVRAICWAADEVVGSDRVSVGIRRASMGRHRGLTQHRVG
jgi:hypothetical protein